MDDLHHARLIVSAHSLLPLSVAARLIGGREARAWLEAHVRIRWVAGQRRVLWRDVIEATEAPRPASTPRRASGGLRVADY